LPSAVATPVHDATVYERVSPEDRVARTHTSGIADLLAATD
jgi:hypothetical protein